MPNPHRRLSDPRELTALAHPVRMAIIELLSISGPLTATELADRLDETPANCSWHLRKLARARLRGGGRGRHGPAAAVAGARDRVPVGRRARVGVGRGAARSRGAVRGDDGPGARPAARGAAADGRRARGVARRPVGLRDGRLADGRRAPRDERRDHGRARPPHRAADGPRPAAVEGRDSASSWRGVCRRTSRGWTRREEAVRPARVPTPLHRAEHVDARRLGDAAGAEHVGEDPHRLQRDGRPHLLLHGAAGARRASARRLDRPAATQADPGLGQPGQRGGRAAAGAGQGRGRRLADLGRRVPVRRELRGAARPR